jgi:phospholipid/cholesterol/gamma-HCH transport system substrate-binding protein
MQTQVPSWRRLVPLVAFALLCVALMIYGWIAVGGSTPLQAGGYRIQVEVPEAGGIYQTNDVRMSGVTIGEISGVKREGDRAVLAMSLKPRYAPLRVGTRAIVRTKTLLGEGYVELAPGPVGAHDIPEGGRLPLSQARRAQRLDDVLQMLGPTTRKQMRGLFSGLARATRGRAGDLNSALGRLAPTVTNIADLVTTLDQQRPALRDAIAASGDVFSAMAEREGDLRAAVVSGNEVFATTAARNRELAATIGALPPFLRRLRSTSRTLSAAAPDVDAAVRALEPVARVAGDGLASLDRAAPAYRQLLGDLPPLIRTADRGLPALQRTLRGLAPGLDGLHELTRQLLPVVTLLNVARDTVVGSLANVGSAQNTRVEGPGGLIGSAASAVPTIWNESVGGWKKRLPTNRLNSYPKPNSADDITTGGLKAYDCRNIHNTLYLPPTGSVPACKEQGPWTFNGTTAYYPRLWKAPPG